MENEKKASGGGALTVLLFLLVLALAGALAWIIFGEEFLASRQEQGAETARLENRADGEQSGDSQGSADSGEENPGTASGSQSGSFVPLILPDGAGDPGDVTPFAQAGGEEESSIPPVSQDAGAAEPAGQEPPPPPPAVDYATANARPAGLHMSTEDFTVTKIGQKTQLTASGGKGSYAWVSKNPGIASVDENGVVTAVASGTTTVIATDGEIKGACIVRVKGLSEKYSLNRSDFTRSVDEGPYQLKVKGYTGDVSWKSSNPAVATVAADGTVTPVAPGFATISATFGEHVRQCFVHVTK